MQKTKRITANDLLRFIRNLNVKHNVDNGEAGSVYMETSPTRNGLGGQCYRVGINGTRGNITITGKGSARQVIEELKGKDWRRILAVAKAEQIRGFNGDRTPEKNSR